MVGVGRNGVASELGVDVAPSAPRVLELLQHDDARPFAQDEAVPLLVEGPTGFRRSVVADRQRPERAEARDHEWGDDCL